MQEVELRLACPEAGDMGRHRQHLPQGSSPELRWSVGLEGKSWKIGLGKFPRSELPANQFVNQWSWG